jgi:ribosome biogenesis GTPase / thiamine phosphate phosphatase
MDRLDGTVIAVRPGWVLVRAGGNEIHCDRPKALKREVREQRNTVAVGDRCAIEILPGGRGVVREIFARRTWIARLGSLRPRRGQVIAANVDALLAVVAVDRPRFRPHTVDRLLVLGQAGGAACAVCLNKVDLAAPGEAERLLAPYRSLDLPLFPVCALTGQGIDDLHAYLAGKTTLMLGPSGVGKSALLNRLLPGTVQRTDEVSRSSGRGVHTTTRVDYFDLPHGGALLDTPGIKTIQPWGVEPGDLAGLFPEFRPYLGACHFGDCLHGGEPGCAIARAAEAEEIPGFRYVSYVRILKGLLSEMDGPGERGRVGPEAG